MAFFILVEMELQSKLIREYHATLLMKDQFQWTPEVDQAFSRLKEALGQAPVLGLADFTSPFVVETDASGIGIGAILSQHHHPLAFFNKPFS